MIDFKKYIDRAFTEAECIGDLKVEVDCSYENYDGPHKELSYAEYAQVKALIIIAEQLELIALALLKEDKP